MASKKSGLGRNLEALLGGANVEPSLVVKQKSADALSRIPVSSLYPSPYQPRKDFEPEALEELSNSIKSQGIIQPIVVRTAADNEYEIIAGERRWRAAKMAGLTQVPVIVKQLSDKAAMAIALIENLQREDLNPLEEARALQRLQIEFSLTQQEVADAVGKSRTSVTNLLRLMQLDPSVQKLLENGDIDMGHAKVLLALPDEVQASAAEKIINEAMTVRQTEEYVQLLLQAVDNSVNKPVGSREKPVQPSAQQLEIIENLRGKFQTKINLKMNQKGRGKITINYRDEKELARILALMG